MKTKIKIESIFGNLLFEHEAEDNTIKKTLEEAVKSGAYLRGAYLVGANLGDANLVGANLGGADLREDWGKLSSASDVLVVGAIGSRNGYTTVFHTDKGIFVQCGCFRGTLDEFAAKVKETHAVTKHERDYNALIEFVKIKFADYDVQTN